ncbi:MAG: hypothetical protein HY887_05085 [Deltaproteobacteria bacterium]|nr:hypothetical protein [Deltaproteobacteria bacterium]
MKEAHMGAYLEGDVFASKAGCDWFGCARQSKVLLRAPERCRECGEVYVSLYSLSRCADHDSMEKI